MKVLGLCSYPVEAAATRYRLVQFVEPLAGRGINLEVRPFLNSKSFEMLYKSGRVFQKAQNLLLSGLRRLADSLEGRKYDVVFVQREAMMFGPPVVEWLTRKIGGSPMILDLDDATYIRYVSPSYGRIGSALKFFGKTDYLIKSSAVVTCGNRFIADYVNRLGTKSVVIPTVVDTDKFRPVEKKENAVPVIGWIGTHSTFPFVEKLFPALQKLAQNHRFKLKIIGAGEASKKNVTGLDVEWLDWKLEREIADFQSFDIGLYPMSVTDSANSDWLAGKSGFKAIQYMSVGVPYVVTPIGVCAEIGRDGETHFSAVSDEEWIDKLAIFLADSDFRKKMGKAGRKYSLENFTVTEQADKLAQTLTDTLRRV